MKKTKLFGLKVAMGSLFALTPLCALTACNTSNNDSTRVESKVFSIKDNAVVGLAPGMTQKDFKQYCASNHNVITIPYGVKEIKAHAFDPTAGGVVVPFGTKIELPTTIKEIEPYAFYHCGADAIEWYGTGKKQLQYIGKAAFCGCELLKSFQFPEALVTGTELNKNGIGSQAFMDCPLLTTLDFSDFKNFDNLLKLKIGHDVFTAGYHYIDSQSTVAYIKLPMNGNQPFETTDANNILVGEFRSRLIASGLAVRYRASDNTWKSIWGFRDSYKEDAEIAGTFNTYYPVPTNWLQVDEDGVLTGIAPQFCVDLPQFNTLFIPNKKVNYNPEETVTDQPITSISSEFNFLNYKAKYTKKITNFEHLWIQDKDGDAGVTAIPKELCSGNATKEVEKETIKYDAFKTALKSVRLPSAITTIGDNAFDLCNELIQVNLNEATSLTSIGADAFAHDTVLANFVSKSATNSTLALSNTITTVGDEAFYNCDSIVGIKLWVPVDSTATLSIGTMAFGSLGGLSQVDASALDYYWHTKTETTPEGATGSFTEWMDIPEEQHYFDNVPEGQGIRIIDLPKGATQKQFIGLEDDETKEHWDKHPTSGFAKLMEQSGENHNFYDWVLNEGYSLRGGSTSLSSRETSAGSDAGHPWKAYHRDVEITTFEEAPHLVGVTDAAKAKITSGDIYLDRENNNVVTWKKGLNPNSSYKFYVSAKYKPSADAEVVEINSDVITLTILKQEFSITTNDSITAEFKQEGSTTFDFKYNDGPLPEGSTVDNIKITSAYQDWFTLDVANKTIKWSNSFEHDTTIELSADFIPEGGTEGDKQFATATIRLYGTEAKQINISGKTAISWHQDEEVKTEKYSAKLEMTSWSQDIEPTWSITEGGIADKIYIEENTGILHYADKTLEAKDYAIKIKAAYSYVTATGATYKYEKTQDVTITVLPAKVLTVSGPESIFHEKGQPRKDTTYTAKLGEDDAPTGTKWSLDQAYEGITINESTGVISVNDSASTAEVKVKATYTNGAGYVYESAEKTVNITVTEARTFTTTVGFVSAPTFTVATASSAPAQIKFQGKFNDGEAFDLSNNLIIDSVTVPAHAPQNKHPFTITNNALTWNNEIYAGKYVINFKSITYIDEHGWKYTVTPPNLEITVNALSFDDATWDQIIKVANFHEARTVTTNGESYNGIKCYYGANCLTKGDSSYIIGKEKSVNVNTQAHTVRLVDTNHDKMANKDKEAAFTFDFKNVICDKNGNSIGCPWNYYFLETEDRNTNYANAATTMHQYLEGTSSWYAFTQKGTDEIHNNDESTTYTVPFLRNQKSVLTMFNDQNIVDNMKTVKKYVATDINKTGIYALSTYDSRLFEPTYYEICPEMSTEITDFLKEGQPYQLFKNATDKNAARIKNQINNSSSYGAFQNIKYWGRGWFDGEGKMGNASNVAGLVQPGSLSTFYWLASPNINNGYNAVGVNQNGSMSDGSWGIGKYWMPVAPMFCI